MTDIFTLVGLVRFSSSTGAVSQNFRWCIARGKHLFPFRTEPLSLSAPMVLGGQPPGRVGRRRSFTHKAASGRLWSFRSRSARALRGSSHARAASPESATRGGRPLSSAGSRSRALPHRRCGEPSPAPPIRAGDRVWDAGRSAGEWAPPRLLAQGRTRQAWRSRSRGRHCRQLAGQGRCARGTWGQSTIALGRNICSARDFAGGPEGHLKTA